MIPGRRVRRGAAALSVTLAALAGCGIGAPSSSGSGAAVDPSPSPDPPGRPGGRPVPVIRVVDGDTFHVLRGGRDVTLRLIGIDTPEVGWYGGEAECFGARAGVFLRNLLHGERVRLEFDAERTDPYGRTLAYAYLDDGRMLNALLVRRGYATVTIYEPNDRYEVRFRAAEASARAADAGLWSTCR